MRITLEPQWVRMSAHQLIVFTILYDQPLHVAMFSWLFEVASKQISDLAKPHLSDLLRALEKKGLVRRSIPRGKWVVTPETMKKLVAQAKEKA
jgi:DNA-binding HxlR family transcriptional regulator